MIGQKGIPCKYGGIERHVEELAKGLVTRGHQVFVYARAQYTEQTVQEYAGVTIVHIPSLHTKHLDTMTHVFLSTIHALFQQYDVIHYHGVGPSLLSFIPRLFTRKTNVIATVHCLDRLVSKWGRFARFVLRLGEWAACRFAYETIAVSKGLREYCQTNYNRVAKYIPNGIAVQKENAQLSSGWQSRLAETFHLKPGEYILNVSRFIPSKNIELLIASFKELRIDQKKLVLVGDAGEYEMEYKRKLHELARGDDRIMFVGWQDWPCLRLLYQGAFLYVHPSSAEGLSTTVIEALAHGAPVVVADIEGNREIINSDLFLVDPNDQKALTKKIEAVIADMDNGISIARALQDKILSLYSWDMLVQQVESLYQSRIYSDVALLRKKSVIHPHL